MQILLIEDEQKAGEKLLSYIRSYVSSEAKVVWIRSLAEVRETLRFPQEFDVIFSDIELLDGNVFSAYQEIEVTAPIIFCTAYDQFFLKAFRTNGIAYLLKPYDKNQFNEAWKKYKLLFEKKQLSITPEIIDELKVIINNRGNEYKSRFSIKKPNGIFLLSTKDIVYFQSQGDFILAIDCNGQKHVINNSLSKLMRLLDPKKFFQINRSEIIHVVFIQKFESHFKNRLAISLFGIKESLFTSNSRSASFRAWIG